MQETEITVQIFDKIENVKKKLVLLGYEEVEEFTGEDDYFSTLSGEELKKAGYQELLNSSIIVRSYFTKTSNKRESMLLFKNKILSEKGDVLSTEKISTKIDNVENTRKLLALSGLKNWAVLKQQNAFYKLDEKIVIVGTVDGLEGCFIEIEEYPSIANLSSEAKFEKLKEFCASFGFKTGNDYSVKKVYMLYQQSSK